WLDDFRGRSVTELEIWHGVLRAPDAAERALFYFRDPAASASVPEPARAAFVDSDPSARAHLEQLKGEVRARGLPVHVYGARWDADAPDRPTRGRGRFVDLDALGERVRADLLA